MTPELDEAFQKFMMPVLQKILQMIKEINLNSQVKENTKFGDVELPSVGELNKVVDGHICKKGDVHG